MKELDTFIESLADPRELKRAVAVRMTLEGYKHQEIIKILQVSSGFISKWKQEFILKGIEGLKLKYQGSRLVFESIRETKSTQMAREKKRMESQRIRILSCRIF